MNDKIVTQYSNRIEELNHSFTKVEDDFYFLLLLSGEAKISVDNTTSTLKANDFLTINPDEKLNIIKSQNAIAYIFSLPWDSLIEVIPHYDRIQCNSQNYPNDHYTTLLKDYICLIQAENNDDSANKTLITSYFYKFIHTIQELVIPDENIQESTSKEDRYKLRIKKIKSFINKNYSQPIKLINLADYLYITPQYLSSFIKKHLGTTFQQLLNETRIHQAAKELLETKNSITKVSFNTGFSNIHSFNTVFKKVYGVSPKIYRTKYNYKEIIQTKEQSLSNKKRKIAEDNLSNLMNDIESKNMFYHKNYDIIANADENTKSFSEKIWQEAINLGFASNLLSGSFQNHIQDVQKNLNFKYGRIQGILNPDIIDKIPDRDTYNFSNFNRIIDFLYSINILPFIDFGNKPQKLNVKIDEYLFISDKPQSTMKPEEWEDFLHSFLNNCINRYGINEVSKWNFELWLPHSSVLSYSSEQISKFVKNYEILYKVFKETIPLSKIGGFGFNAAGDIEIIKKVLSSLNFNNVRFDFFSFSSFHIVNHNNKTPMLTSNENYLENVIDKIKKAIHPFKIPLYLTEFTFDVTTRNYMHDSVFEALYIVRNVLRNSDNLDTIAFWNLSDLSAEYRVVNQILFGGNGLLSIDGLYKPAFYAYKFLSYLGNNVISQGDNYLITSKGAGSYQVLLFNYVHPSELSTFNYINDFSPHEVNDIFVEPKALNYNINIKISTPGKYRIKSYLLNHQHGSIIDEWCRLGIDIPLEKSELDYLNNICVPKQDLKYINIEDMINIQGEINPNEIIFYRIKMEL
jgi:beta-xylosidase/AraC-like DNA-binding protein